MRSTDDLSGQNETKKSTCAQPWCELILVVAWVFHCFSGVALAQAPESQNGDSDKSWVVTTDSKGDYANPTRTIRSHAPNGNRTLDVRSLQTRDADGNLNPYQDIETETLRISATIMRTTTRTFVRDSNGMKTLFQITEEEKQTLPGGGSKVVRTTSNPDANGTLQLIQRENQETLKTSPNVEETKTTVMLPSINGGLAPAIQMQERERRTGDTVEIQKTTLLPDGAGRWQVGEVRHTTIKDEGKSRSSEERMSRPDLEGNLGEVTRTVSRESEGVSGDTQKSEESYSIDLPGAARDSSLHLVQRVTTTHGTNADGQQTTKIEEQPNPGDPGAGLWVTTVTNETVRLAAVGGQATRTIQLRDADGNLGVISVDMTKSDSVHAIEVQIAPPKLK